jgi:hypothetical protein
MEATAAAAGWFDDPHAPGQLRWWDGSQWTEHVAPNPAAQPEPAVAALEVAPEPAAPAAPAAPQAPAAAPAQPAAVPTASSSRGSSIAGRTLAIAGGVLVAVLVLAFAGTQLLGGASTDAGLEKAAAAQPPLTAAEYERQMQAIPSPASLEKLDKNSTPAQMQQAATDLRTMIDAARPITPPTVIAAEHAAMIASMDKVAAGLDTLAANPKDQAAGTAMLSDMLAAASAMQKIETTLGIKLDAADDTSPATVPPTAVPAPASAS